MIFNLTQYLSPVAKIHIFFTDPTHDGRSTITLYSRIYKNPIALKKF